MEVRERIWQTQSKIYLRLLPGAIGVQARGRSKRLERVLTDFGVEHSFVQAARQVEEHYGFRINASAVRLTTLRQAQRAREQLEQEYKEPFRVLPAQGAKYVIAEADGTMICTIRAGRRKSARPREWKEMRLAAAQAHGKTQTWYAASFGEVDQVGRRWGHCARKAGWGLNSRIHALGDGAEWIELQTREVFGKQGTYLCDYFHVSEYLAEAALSCRAQGPRGWRQTQQKRLKRGALEPVLEELKAHLESDLIPDEQAPVRACHRYLNNRTDSLDYKGALQLGLPIGSGMIESGHRHVLQARLKGAGTAWLIDNAERMATLRVLRANDQWLSLWN